MERTRSEGSSSCLSLSSSSMDIDLEVLELFTTRLDRCRRDREKLRGLLRSHRTSLTELEHEDTKIRSTKNAALEALDAKRRVLEADLKRRYSAAVADVVLESNSRKDAVKRRKSALQCSLMKSEAALHALEKKMTQNQNKFFQKYVQLMEDVNNVIEKASRLLSKKNIPSRETRNSTALEDFRNLVVKTVKPLHRKKSSKVKEGPIKSWENFYNWFGEWESDTS